jgi:hypothetical protein
MLEYLLMRTADDAGVDLEDALLRLATLVPNASARR